MIVFYALMSDINIYYERNACFRMINAAITCLQHYCLVRSIQYLTNYSFDIDMSNFYLPKLRLINDITYINYAYLTYIPFVEDNVKQNTITSRNCIETQLYKINLIKLYLFLCNTNNKSFESSVKNIHAFANVDHKIYHYVSVFITSG